MYRYRALRIARFHYLYLLSNTQLVIHGHFRNKAAQVDCKSFEYSAERSQAPAIEGAQKAFEKSEVYPVWPII